jgi:hypothetical protein
MAALAISFVQRLSKGRYTSSLSPLHCRTDAEEASFVLYGGAAVTSARYIKVIQSAAAKGHHRRIPDRQFHPQSKLPIGSVSMQARAAVNRAPVETLGIHSTTVGNTQVFRDIGEYLLCTDFSVLQIKFHVFRS